MSLIPEIKRYIDQTVDKKIREIQKKLVLSTEDSLVKIWDNKYDDRWDGY